MPSVTRLREQDTNRVVSYEHCPLSKATVKAYFLSSYCFPVGHVSRGASGKGGMSLNRPGLAGSE